MTGKKNKTGGSVRKTDVRIKDRSEKGSDSKLSFKGWIATASLEYADENKYDTQHRLEILSKIIKELGDKFSGNGSGLLVLPGGWIDSGGKKPEEYFKRIEQVVSSQLKGTKNSVCLGIDGGLDVDGYSADQIGLVINSSGIVAAGRKFHPSPQERSHVDLCQDFISGECGYPRKFEFSGKTGFIAVCYDSYGIRHENLENPGVDFVVNLVHCFYPKGDGPSGEQYFAKHGFAGASKQWGCPVYGTAVYYNRGMPEKWPTGVLWNCGDLSTTKWRYENNPISWDSQFSIKSGDANVIVRLFVNTQEAKGVAGSLILLPSGNR